VIAALYSWRSYYLWCWIFWFLLEFCCWNYRRFHCMSNNVIWLLYLWLWNVCVWSIKLNCDLLDSAYTAQPQWLHVYECWDLMLLQCTTCTRRHHSVCAANCIPLISDFTWAPQYFHRAPNFSAFMGLQIYTQSERHKVRQHIPVDNKRLNILQS